MPQNKKAAPARAGKSTDGKKDRWTSEQRAAEIAATRETLTTLHGQIFADEPSVVTQ